MAGRFVWHEVLTTDVAAATAFYADVVGWTATDSGVPGVDYTLLSMGEAWRVSKLPMMWPRPPNRFVPKARPPSTVSASP